MTNQIQLGVVRQPAPDRTAPDLPRFRRPGVHTQILAAIVRVERLEVGADEHFRIGAGVVRAPDLTTRARIERHEPAAHAELAAAVTDQHSVLHHERCHGDGLALVDVCELSAPALRARCSVERNHLTVERGEQQLTVRILRAAIDHITARDTLSRCDRLRLVFPFGRRAGLGQIERIHVIGIRRDDVHRVADDDRCGFVTADDARGERERHLQLADVLSVDLIEPAEAGRGIVLTRHRPVAIFGRRCSRGRLRRLRRARVRCCDNGTAQKPKKCSVEKTRERVGRRSRHRGGADLVISARSSCAWRKWSSTIGSISPA